MSINDLYTKYTNDYSVTVKLIFDQCLYQVVFKKESLTEQWSPTGIARGILLHAQVGRHLPTEVGTHSSTGKARGLLLPGSNVCNSSDIDFMLCNTQSMRIDR
jgi:hypothetical protein